MTSMEEIRRVKTLIDQLKRKASKPGELHSCPVCGGRLHVRFDIYSREHREIIGIHAWCEDCDVAITIDSAELPAWALREQPYADSNGTKDQ